MIVGSKGDALLVARSLGCGPTHPFAEQIRKAGQPRTTMKTVYGADMTLRQNVGHTATKLAHVIGRILLTGLIEAYEHESSAGDK
jgi:hypothetical protein